jgi:hypothetical protein
MNEIHVMERVPGEAMNKAIAVYLDRCMLLIDKAFQKDFDTRKAFEVWAKEEFAKTKSPAVLLHDDPIYMVARYLGIQRLQIDQGVMRRATKIATDNHW